MSGSKFYAQFYGSFPGLAPPVAAIRVFCGDHIVAELDSALNEWIDTVPNHRV
jgi:hypothetical protein